LQIAPGYDGVRPNMGKMPKKVSEMFSPNVPRFRPVVHQIGRQFANRIHHPIIRTTGTKGWNTDRTKRS
jgi:hypothetical protein